jgi:stage IV sporulation protein FB
MSTSPVIAEAPIVVCAEPLGIIFLLFSLLLDREVVLPCYAAALFHECGHLLAARLLRIPIRSLTFTLFGFRLSLVSGLISYRRELMLAASGPLFSFVLGVVTLSCAEGGFASSLHFATLALGVLNLLPVKRFDGGRMLYALLASIASPSFASRVLDLMGASILLFLWTVSVYFLLHGGFGLSLFIFSFAVFCKSFL